ncbi:MAG: glycosyltransferase, partial [Solirubrobacterales bacterium]
MSAEQKTPMFSILSVIKNVTSREAMFRRSIESVLGQTCGDFEFVIQDGASTDGTAHIVAEYRDPRIRFASVADSLAEEGFFNALKRCRGKYIGSCWSDEELFPDALEKALRAFEKNPGAAAVYGNYWLVDENGRKAGPFAPRQPFSIQEYVCQRVVPPFCSSFFSRESLERAGLHEHPWRYGIGEFEFWIRLAGAGPVRYVPVEFSHFGRHPKSETNSAALYDRLADERAAVMEDLFRENPVLRDAGITVHQAIAGNYAWAAYSVHGIEGASDRYRRFVETVSAFDPRHPYLPHLMQQLAARRAPGQSVEQGRNRQEVVESRRSTNGDDAALEKQSETPYLSVVAVSRNDDHGGNLKLRMQLFINCLAAQAEKHRLPTELVLVEWNPPADRPRLKDALRFPSEHPFCSMRIVEVPASVHARYQHARTLPVYQMIAKNVGIRRARGRFVLATNVDIVFSDALFSRLAEQNLESGCFYRSVRYDVDNRLTAEMPLDAVLTYCRSNVIRKNVRDYSLNVRDGSKHVVFSRTKTAAQLGYPKLFTNACGDFTLLSKQDWEHLRGYAELDTFSMHLDSLFLFAAHYGGLKEIVFSEDLTHYHIEHGEGWTPESHKDKTLDNRLDALQIPQIERRGLADRVRRMSRGEDPVVSNNPQWGVADVSLSETAVTVAGWESGQRPSQAIPYLSFVVTTRNDNHGGDQLQRFQSFLDHLGRMCGKHRLAAELIVVEWNPDPDRPCLADAMRWPDPTALDVRIITVPASIHAGYRNADKFPLFQMIAKNVGVRRARGEFVLATNIDLLFSDELIAWLARRELRADCFYRIDRHDIGETSIPQGLSAEEVLDFCARHVVRVHAQRGTHRWGEPPRAEDPQRLHTNACGDFTLMARAQWERLKGYPEYELWSIHVDGLLIHAAHVAGLRQTILRDPLRMYHIEHGLGWAVTRDTVAERPSLDYRKDYLPMCRKMLEEKKPMDVNKVTWGLSDIELSETRPAAGVVEDRRTAADRSDVSNAVYARWIDTLAAVDNRLYYRDQSSRSLASLVETARRHDPTLIVELGTLEGLSLRAWLTASQRAKVVAVDLSFAKLAQTQRILPADLSRVTLLEQDILKTDFTRLWTSQDKIVFFVDAHDLPHVPIMNHVLTTALPSLPDGSVVVVDDLWFSSDRLTPDNARSFFEGRVLGEIDELQCFTGYYAPYHRGGSFMGFAEVGPLLEFVNKHGIELTFDPAGKHVSFVWDRRFLSRHPTTTDPEAMDAAGCRGSVAYNPLDMAPVSSSLRETMRILADAYRQGKVQPVVENLERLVAAQPNDQGLRYGLAVCRARRGMLVEARNILERGAADSRHPRAQRLLGDLVRHVESGLSHSDCRPETPSNSDGLTLFAMPKPFVGHVGLIQRNAIRSWAKLPSKPEIILFGNEPGIREMAEEVGARHIPEVGRNEHGTPVVSELFHAAEKHASHSTLAYVNADMILMSDFVQAVQKVRTRFSQFLLIGQRWDLTILDPIDFDDPRWQVSLCKRCEAEAFIHGECGLDYFVFHAGCWPQIPPFAIGRTAWDNWLVMDPQRRCIPVIDGTDFITAVHQDHAYGHVAGGRQDAWHGVEAVRNRTLAGAIGECGRTCGTPWVLREDGKLAEMPPRQPLYKTRSFRNDRSRWLFDNAQKLAAAGQIELAACKSQEAIENMVILIPRMKNVTQADREDCVRVAQRFVASYGFLADCYIRMGQPDQAVEVYTLLLENPHVPIPPALRDTLVRMRDGLARLHREIVKPERADGKPPEERTTISVSPASSPTTAAGSRPKVTVVTACRNGERYLSQCIESVLKQTMPEWEYFLLDDGSSDGTRRIMEEYARRDPRIHVHCFDDSRGPYVRRNFAIGQASGPFIVIQDSDDLMGPGKLERLYEAITRDDRLAVVGSFYRLFLDGCEELEHTEPMALLTSQDSILQAYRTRGVCDWCWHGSAIMRKRILDEIGLYDENPFGSDSVLLGKVAEYAYRNREIRIENIPEVLTMRRMHADSQVGRLPVFDPRSRRMAFSRYRRKQFALLAAKLDANPKADVKMELRNAACNSFTQEFGHLFASWESQPLTSQLVDSFVRTIHGHFAEQQFIRCVVTCGVVERMVQGIAGTVRCYDLVRGASYFALGLPEKSRECLMREFETHGTRAARDCCTAWLDRYNPFWSRADRIKIIARSLFGVDSSTGLKEGSSPAVRLLLDRRKNSQVGLSVIVPCGRDARIWTRCVAALNAQTTGDFEVIVLIDEGMQAEAATLANDLTGSVVVLAGREQANPWVRKNLAVGHARGQYVAFLAEGVLPEPRFVEATLRRLAAHQINGLRGRILSDGATSPVGFDLGAEVLPAMCDLDEMCVFRKDTFVRLGGYPTTSFARGALSLSYRIYTDCDASRRPILYCPDVAARHVAIPSSQGGLIDSFSLENRLSLSCLARMKHVCGEHDEDQIAFLAFAREHYAQGTQTDEQRYTQAVNIALFFERRYPQLAIQWAEKAIAFHPDSLKARCVLSSSYADLSRHDQAACHLEKALPRLETLVAEGPATQEQPEFTDRAVLTRCYVSACTLLAQCYTKMRQYERVSAVYSRLVGNPHVALDETRREEIRRVLKALTPSSADVTRDRTKRDAAPVGHSVSAEVPVSVAASQGNKPAVVDACETRSAAERRCGIPEVAHEERAGERTAGGDYASVFVDLERKFQAMSKDSPAKQALAVRIGELARRTGFVEKRKTFQNAAAKIRNRLDYEKARQDKPAVCAHKPLAVEFNVIMRCNAGCIMCEYTPQGEILPLDRFKVLADQLLPAAQETLLIGGEVLMHPDFHGICEYAHSFGGSLRMTTNLHT